LGLDSGFSVADCSELSQQSYENKKPMKNNIFRLIFCVTCDDITDSTQRM